MLTINGNNYEIISAYKLRDQSWGNRLAYVIKLRMGFVEAHELFVNGVGWSLDGVDHADYNVAGRITDFRDGTLEVLMGQATEAELEKAAAEAETARILPIIQKVLPELGTEDAISMTMYFPTWETDKAYGVGEKVQYGGILYNAITAHTSQFGWEPDMAPSLWARVLIAEPDLVPEWVQPDSTNGYMTGDHVMYNGAEYVSTVDNNVWAPDAYGWELANG